jgi:predicted MFS family arabinose efflux permease
MNELHDPLEAALREPEPELTDDEFSANVLARLPPQRRRMNARRWTVAGSAALGSALTLAFAAPLETVISSISPWSVPPLALSAVAVIAIVALPTLLVFFTERADR